MAKRKEPKGTTTIEFNRSGIPDDELKPEDFNDHQLAVLKALPPERQAPIRRGCPVSVIDLATGNQKKDTASRNTSSPPQIKIKGHVFSFM